MPRQAAALVFILACVGSTFAVVGAARAQGDYEPLRSLGAGGTMRAFATGDVGLAMNPSGMSLSRIYSMEADYLHGFRDSAHAAHASIVDTTSGLNLGGGISYTYFRAKPDPGPNRDGHDVRAALSFPFGDKVAIGIGGRYLNVKEPVDKSGFSGDAGLTARPFSFLAVGLVGYNLIELDTPFTERAMGYGLAVVPWPDLVIAVDGVTTFAKAAAGMESKTHTSLMAGGEMLLAKKVALRAGGGRDGTTEHSYLGLGASIVSEEGAIDVGFRRDLSGDGKATHLGVGLRLFVPQ